MFYENLQELYCQHQLYSSQVQDIEFVNALSLGRYGSVISEHML